MNNMNFKTVKATYKSYVDALGRLDKRGFTSLNRTGSGYTHYLGETFESYGGDIEEADSVSIRISGLFEVFN